MTSMEVPAQVIQPKTQTRFTVTPVNYGWPFVAEFNNVYLYATIYIDSTSTQDIFIQRQHWFNFNTGYFHSTTIFIQLQHGLFLCKTNIYSTSTPKVMFYETNIYIQLLGYVHTKPDKFENATFFIRIGLPSTLKRCFRCPKTELFENALQSG